MASGWNLCVAIWMWVWLECINVFSAVGVVVRRYINFPTLLIPTALVLVLFCSSIPTSLFIF